MNKVLGCISVLSSVGISVFGSVAAFASPALQSPVQKEKSVPLKVGSLRELKRDSTCNGTGGIMTYAETQNHRIYICADKSDRTQPRYYRSRSRNGSRLDLEAKNYDPRQMRYFEFKNNGYTYILQMPMAAIPNPNLSVQFPNGRIVEERVLRYLAKQ